MIGLIIGVLWFVFASLVGKQAPEVAVLNISNFLFYWYAGWWGAFMLFWLGVWMLSFLADKGVGVVMTLAMPIIIVLCSLSTALYCTAMYLVYHAGDAAESLPLAEWDRGYLIGAAVCIGLALLFGLATRISNSGSKD